MTIRVTHFMRRPRPNNFSIERLYNNVRAALPEDCRTTVWTCREFSNGLLPRLRDMWRARRYQEDVNHVTGDVHYLTFLLDPKRTVLTVHDLVLLGQLRGIRRWLVWLLWYWIPVRRSRAVVAISETTRAALLDSVRCDPKKVHVIHNPVSEEFQPEQRQFGAVHPRILQIGTKPNKNLDRVAQALEGIPCRLVVVGPLSKTQIETLRRHGIEHENHVGLSSAALVAQYSMADMLVFASTYEGFGMPIVEAQATGLPVVTSNVSSMPEIAGTGACTVDPLDVASIRASVIRVISDNNYRDTLIKQGFENSKRFSATKVAAHYAKIYREVAGGD